MIFLALCSTALIAQQKNLSVYAPQMYYQVSIVDHGGKDYVGLIDLLEPIGRVESRADGKKWQLRFTGTGPTVEAEFQDGRTGVKIGDSGVNLSGNFALQGDRGYVPVASLVSLLPRIMDRAADLHLGAGRLFIGSSAMKLSLELRHAPDRMVATFPNPVSPQVASDGTHLQIVFSRDPVVPGTSGMVSYNEPPFASSNMTEANGTAVLSVTGTAPLQAQFSDGGKTLTISAVTPQQSAPASPSSVPAQQPAAVPAAPSTESPAAPSAKPRLARTLVVLDAGHGGDERGAQLTDTLNEKDVALALARRIQHELEARGFPVSLLRSGDTTLAADQRAIAANGARPFIYVSVHAATLGTGVRIFTAMIPAAQRANRHAFLPWDTAQAPFIPSSNSVADAIALECKNHKLPVRTLAAPVRPLNSISAPAIAIEIAPQGDTVESITDAKYQQDVASAIAAGIAASRGKLEAQ
ncbi:MAG TPA: N-acetylmuramoyl-L-alanine amidase [Terriglobales bacterium]|nr:N-acetylmuramoyl-L-alanine amidase [Terriglobales bacterium]